MQIFKETIYYRFWWAHLKDNEKIFTPSNLGKIKGFCGFIDPKLPRSDNYAAAILISLLIKDFNLDEAEKIISDFIIKEINKNKSNLKLLLLHIMDLQKLLDKSETNKKNKISIYLSKIEISTFRDINISLRKAFKRFSLISKIT